MSASQLEFFQEADSELETEAEAETETKCLLNRQESKALEIKMSLEHGTPVSVSAGRDYIVAKIGTGRGAQYVNVTP